MRGTVQPQWGFFSLFMVAPWWISTLVVTTHSDSVSKWILKNKIHRFSINSCSSSWRCQGKVQREAPQKPSCWLIWLCLNSDLVAHLIQRAEVSHLLVRQCRPKGRRWWGRGVGIEKDHLVFDSENSTLFSWPFRCLPPAPPPPALVPSLTSCSQVHFKGMWGTFSQAFQCRVEKNTGCQMSLSSSNLHSVTL